MIVSVIKVEGNINGKYQAVFFNDDMDKIEKFKHEYTETTCNQAYYKAIKTVLEHIKQYNIKILKIVSCSEVIINQLKGEYNIHNAGLRKLHDKVKSVENTLNCDIEYIFTRRDEFNLSDYYK